MKRFSITLLALIALVAFVVLFLRAFYYFPSDEVPLPIEVEKEIIDDINVIGNVIAAPQAETPKEAPKILAPLMRLTIPAIDVDAKVEEVGITSKGNMAAPRKFSEVGWYKYGTIPGETGSAVIAGHVDNGIAWPAVFHDLEDLKEGDDIYIETEEGKKLHFVVIGRKTYPFDSSPEEVFVDKSGKFLKLITCTGKIIKEFRTHAERLVVNAELVVE